MNTVNGEFAEGGSAAHSAGPWYIFAEDEDYIHIERIKDGQGDAIIDVFCSEENERDIEECRANARLVVQAPRLLALARKLAIVCEDRLAGLREEEELLTDFFSEEAESDIADRRNHYASLKREAEACIAVIEGRATE